MSKTIIEQIRKDLAELNCRYNSSEITYEQFCEEQINIMKEALWLFAEKIEENALIHPNSGIDWDKLKKLRGFNDGKRKTVIVHLLSMLRS